MTWVENRSKTYHLSLVEPLSPDELILGSAEIAGSQGTGGHTVDRWKQKEAIKTIAGYVQALSPLILAIYQTYFTMNMLYFETELF